MGKTRKIILTINEFDNSGESGILADIKCFEQHKIYGFATTYILEDIKQIIENNSIDFIKIKITSEIHFKLLTEISFFKIPVLAQIDSFIKPLSNKANYIVGSENINIKSDQTIFKLHSNPFDIKNRDYLISGGKEFPIRQKGKRINDKNGWRDVFSSSLSANIVRGYPIIKACLKAKDYTARFLESNEGNCGYHYH